MLTVPGPGPPQPRKKKDLIIDLTTPCRGEGLLFLAQRPDRIAAAAQRICELPCVIERNGPLQFIQQPNPWWQCLPAIQKTPSREGAGASLMYVLPRNRAVAQTRTPRRPFWPTESGVEWVYQGKCRRRPPHKQQPAAGEEGGGTLV